MTDKAQNEKEDGYAADLKRGVMRHYYCFSYVGRSSEDGHQCQACTYVGYDERRITKSIIEENKIAAGVDEDAVLLAVSYLGHMTREEMLGA